MTWRFENEGDGYIDYDFGLPDMNGHGGRLRLTLNCNNGTAYMVIVLDDMNGTEHMEHCTSPIPLAWANAIASGVDGFTLTPTEEVTS